MPKSPLALVKEQFKSKQSLLDAVKSLATDELWVDRVSKDKGLPHVSNKKLLHLHSVLSEVKKEHGTRAKLIDALLSATGRGKDADFRTSLESKSTPALYQQYVVAKRKSAANANADKPKTLKPQKVAKPTKAQQAAAKPQLTAKAARAAKAKAKAKRKG